MPPNTTSFFALWPGGHKNHFHDSHGEVIGTTWRGTLTVDLLINCNGS